MPPLIPDVVGDSDETEEVVVVVFGVVPELLMGALIGQHEHSPGKAGIEENKVCRIVCIYAMRLRGKFLRRIVKKSVILNLYCGGGGEFKCAPNHISADKLECR